MNPGPEGNPGWAWVSTEEAILDGDTFSFPEHCGGQHQQQKPRQPARLVLWNENTASPAAFWGVGCLGSMLRPGLPQLSVWLQLAWCGRHRV